MADQNTETIRVSESAWKVLNAHKDPGDTFADVVDQFIDERDQLKYQTEDHRLANAEPTTVPEDAPRDENNDPEEL
jgi:predicted CopG family antitoxin